MTDKFTRATTRITTKYGEFELDCFAWGDHEEDNILCVSKRPWEVLPLVRIQSACYTAEIFRSLDCDCHEQLDKSLSLIAAHGGVLLYMLCDGRGAGLLKKVQGLELGRTQGLDTADAYQALGIPGDARAYQRATACLIELNIAGLRLLTNNPRKLDGIRASGLHAVREPIEITPTAESSGYLRTKAVKMGHMLSVFTKPQKE